jgi:hypothetical protein
LEPSFSFSFSLSLGDDGRCMDRAESETEESEGERLLVTVAEALTEPEADADVGKGAAVVTEEDGAEGRFSVTDCAAARDCASCEAADDSGFWDENEALALMAMSARGVGGPVCGVAGTLELLPFQSSLSY